jgi:hypothetical protein
MLTFSVSILMNYQRCIVIDFDSLKKIEIEVLFGMIFHVKLNYFL